MGKVIFYGQDFDAMGLKQGTGDDWFCVDEASRSQSVICPWGETDQRQLYYNLFDFQRRQKVEGGELVCGIGIARKFIIDEQSETKRQVWHPVILIHLEIVESDGHIRILPSRMHVPALWSMSPLCSNDNNEHKVRDLEDKFQSRLQELEARQQQISPFDSETFEGFLGEFRRCWRGDLISTNDAPIRPASYEDDDLQAYWQALERKELQLINEWVLFTRSSGLSARKKDIQSFIHQLDCTEAPPWASFLGVKLLDPSALPPCDDAGAAGAAHEGLFPFASNKQQQEIAEMLGHQHTVVVQGPPGTGKTHTLANVVSDAVANGRRVLVVSAGQHALQVLLEKLPKSLQDVAMFFGDGQTQDQSCVIRAVEQMQRIVEERRRPEVVAQVAADKERLRDSMQEGRSKKGRIETELQLRAELMLLPFDTPLRAWRQGPLAEACRLREAVRAVVGEGPLKRKHLLGLTLALCCPHQAGEEAPEWLEDLPADTRAELTARLTDEVVPHLSAVFERDLYRELERTESALLRATKELIGLHVKERFWESSRQLPAVSVLANQFLEQLRAGQGSGRGHQARHWKLAREILAQDRTLVLAFPLWIMTTGMVAELLPPSFGLFDLVAIDEASKSEVYELPALLRGDRVLVIGDNKQVSPNDHGIHDRRLQELARLREGITPHRAMQCAFEPGRSVFDVFHGLHVNTPAVRMLREHFRCTQDIIRFCNDAFYRGELEPLRVSRRGERMVPPIRVNAQAEEAEAGGAAAAEEARAAERERLVGLAAALDRITAEQLKNECRVTGPAAPPPPPPPLFPARWTAAAERAVLRCCARG